jgi:hypothetical protein
LDDTRLLTRAPALDPGKYAIEVHNPDGTMARQNAILTYIFDVPSSPLFNIRSSTEELDADEWGNAGNVAEQTLYDDREPSIVSVTPCVSPFCGTQMTLSGKHISRNCTIKVGGIDVKIVRHDIEYCDDAKKDTENATCTVVFNSPALSAAVHEQFKTVDFEVRNPRGGRTILEDMIAYFDLPDEPPSDVPANAASPRNRRTKPRSPPPGAIGW